MPGDTVLSYCLENKGFLRKRCRAWLRFPLIYGILSLQCYVHFCPAHRYSFQYCSS